MKKTVEGVARFRNDVYPKYRSLALLFNAKLVQLSNSSAA